MSEVRYASHSSLVKHRECPQRWYYGHVRKLARDETQDAAVERDMGSWWHMLLAADGIERGRATGSIRYVPEKLTGVDGGPELDTGEIDLVGHILDLAEAWWGRQSVTTQESWAERLGEDLPGRLRALYGRWLAQWAREHADEQVLAVELRWERRLPSVEQPVQQPGGGFVPLRVDPNVVLVGYVDVIIYDRRRHVVIARDYKAKKKLAAQTTADDMMDSQLQLYAWGADPLVRPWGLGGIGATAYDRARMVRPTEPKITASGGLSKSVTDYDLQTYLDWAKGPDGQGVPWGVEGEFFKSGPRKDEPKYGLYQVEQKEVERLSTPAAVSAWFQRTGPTPLNVHLVRAHLRAAVDSAVDMGLSYERVKLEGSAARNLSINNCRYCDFTGLCRTEMVGGAEGDYDLTDYGLTAKRESGR